MMTGTTDRVELTMDWDRLVDLQGEDEKRANCPDAKADVDE
jgi:hypothetical protein